MKQSVSQTQKLGKEACRKPTSFFLCAKRRRNILSTQQQGRSSKWKILIIGRKLHESEIGQFSSDVLVLGWKQIKSFERWMPIIQQNKIMLRTALGKQFVELFKLLVKMQKIHTRFRHYIKRKQKFKFRTNTEQLVRNCKNWKILIGWRLSKIRWTSIGKSLWKVHKS